MESIEYYADKIENLKAKMSSITDETALENLNVTYKVLNSRWSKTNKIMQEIMEKEEIINMENEYESSESDNSDEFIDV